ncbi:MAG: hypothetical protein MI746_02575, partial [Pseudomonadales bacterium]|nr:hypothetical protein [Pseudomonadales bacterium]
MRTAASLLSLFCLLGGNVAVGQEFDVLGVFGGLAVDRGNAVHVAGAVDGSAGSAFGGAIEVSGGDYGGAVGKSYNGLIGRVFVGGDVADGVGVRDGAAEDVVDGALLEDLVAVGALAGGGEDPAHGIQGVD